MSKPVKFVKIVTPIALAIALSACGGGSGADFGSGSNTGTTTGTTTEEETGTGTAEELVFTLQPLEIGLGLLSAGGSTGVTTRLIDQNGDLAKEEYTAIFTSPCISNGTSEITSPIVSSNGVFTTNYIAKGCEGDDKITATVDGLSVESTVNVQAASLGQVEFISASPQNILLSGMSAPGQQHTSTVTFQIKNDVGGPIPNADVTFELTTDVGGIKLSTTEGKTDNNGFVSTILQAGTVHTSVRVRAIVVRDNVTISSESSQLVISTGIADQNSLSLSLSVQNPEAWNYDGEKVNVNLHASDRYNNPVPDGTTIAFFTELGQIQPSCQTANGVCVVEWTSSDPRDLGTLDPLYPRSSLTSNSDGITTITAVVIGEESFIDTNSNGIFDDGDQLDLISDRGEAFEDYNMRYDTNTPRDNASNNQHDAGLEPFLDFNGNGVRDPNDSKYTGLGCAHSTLCGSDNGLKQIFSSIELVMAESNQSIRIWEGGIGGTEVNTIRNGVSYTIEVFGVTNNQIPPEGTAIATVSDTAEVLTGSATVGSTNQHNNNLTSPSGNYGVSLFVTDTDPEVREDGFIEITVSTPKGQTVTFFKNYQDDDVLETETTPTTTADTTPPSIFISGENPVTITQGEVYTDAGATAVDLVDGVLTVSVVSGLPLDTSLIGTQSIVYRAVDSSNNVTQEVRQVEIVAPDVPLILLDDATSENNVFNDLVLTVGDIYFPNESAIDLTDGNVTVTVSGDVVPVDGINRTTTAGTYNVTYTAIDSDGNVGIATRTVIVNP